MRLFSTLIRIIGSFLGIVFLFFSTIDLIITIPNRYDVAPYHITGDIIAILYSLLIIFPFRRIKALNILIPYVFIFAILTLLMTVGYFRAFIESITLVVPTAILQYLSVFTVWFLNLWVCFRHYQTIRNQ